jgi:hypothetical protein
LNTIAVHLMSGCIGEVMLKSLGLNNFCSVSVSTPFKFLGL